MTAYAYIHTYRTQEGFLLLYCSTGDQRRHQGIKSHLFRATHTQIFGTREGKRTAEEEAEELNVKKARVDGDEDVMMASVTEPSTSKCTSLSVDP